MGQFFLSQDLNLTAVLTKGLKNLHYKNVNKIKSYTKNKFNVCVIYCFNYKQKFLKKKKCIIKTLKYMIAFMKHQKSI